MSAQNRTTIRFESERHWIYIYIFAGAGSSFGGDGPRAWWNNTDFPELTSCQLGFSSEQITAIDAEARHRCQTLLSVDDTYMQLVDAVVRNMHY